MMYQSCGKCEACLARLASARSIKVGVQASLSKHVMFLTLTYDTYHVPKCKIYYNGDKSYRLVVKPRVKDYFYETRKDGSKKEIDRSDNGSHWGLSGDNNEWALGEDQDFAEIDNLLHREARKLGIKII